MASSQIQQNLIPNEPSLKDLLDLLKKDILLSLCAHHIGTVQSFDESRQTATATINYKKTTFRLDPATGLYNPILSDYPVLLDCPVMFLGGGKSSLTFPVQAGDECLVIFNDRDLDNWLSGGSGSPVATPRLHSFSDGIILVGIRSLANALTVFDTTRVAIKNDQAMVGVGPVLIRISNNSTSLNSLLQNLITTIQALVNATSAITVTGVTAGVGVSGVPANAATITAINVTLSALAVQIGGLLE